MKKKPKRRSTPSSDNKLKTFAINSLFAAVFYILLFLITGFICYKADIDKDKYYIIMLIITAISALFAGFKQTGTYKEKGLINGTIGSIPIAVFTFVLAILFNNGIPTLKTIPAVILSVICGAVSGTFAVNIRR